MTADIVNATRMLNESSFLLCDDVWEKPNMNDEMYKSDATFQTLKFFSDAGLLKTNFIFKRLTFFSSGRRSNKEYIGVSRLIST